MEYRRWDNIEEILIFIAYEDMITLIWQGSRESVPEAVCSICEGFGREHTTVMWI